MTSTTERDELKEKIKKFGGIKNPLDLTLLTNFYEECEEILQDDTIMYNYRDKRACKKRALELIMAGDPRIFGSHKLFGTVRPELYVDPFGWKKIVDFLTQDIFFNIIGQYYLDEDTFLKNIINFNASDKRYNYHVYGKVYKEIYSIIAARCKLPTLKKVEFQIELRDPMNVLIENIRARSGALLEVTDPEAPDLSERPNVIRIDKEKILNFDKLWEKAKIVYIKEKLLSTDEFKLDYEKIINKVKKLKNHLLKFIKLLKLPDNNDSFDEALTAKMKDLMIYIREENILPIREDIDYKLSAMTKRMADNLEESTIQKIKRLDEHLVVPQTIYIDMNSKSNYHNFSGGVRGVRYPFVAAIGTITMSDDSEKKHRYYINPNIIGHGRFSGSTPWAKFPIQMIETKFINSGLGSLVFPKSDGTMLRLESADEDHLEENPLNKNQKELKKIELIK